MKYCELCSRELILVNRVLKCHPCDVEYPWAEFDDLDPAKTAKGFDPIVIHQSTSDPNKFSFPGHSADAVPEGYRKIEIANLREADRWTKRINAIEHEKGRELQDLNRQYFEEQTKEMRERVDSNMRRLGLDGSGRARFLRDAVRAFTDRRREQIRARQRSGSPNFNIQVISRDSTNRQGYSDVRTEWKEKRV